VHEVRNVHSPLLGEYTYIYHMFQIHTCYNILFYKNTTYIRLELINSIINTRDVHVKYTYIQSVPKFAINILMTNSLYILRRKF